MLKLSSSVVERNSSGRFVLMNDVRNGIKAVSRRAVPFWRKIQRDLGSEGEPKEKERGGQRRREVDRDIPPVRLIIEAS